MGLPVRTSPLPAVASAGFAAGFTNTVPSGCATSVDPGMDPGPGSNVGPGSGSDDAPHSLDATGKYISVSGKEHIDHGTAVMKGGKACFTSAMTKDGEVCWTDPMVAVGGSGETTSTKGEKLTVKRVAYVPRTM